MKDQAQKVQRGQGKPPPPPPPTPPPPKRKDVRAGQRETMGAFFKVSGDPLNSPGMARWSQLSANERDYLRGMLAYYTLVSLHSLEARLEELRDEAQTVSRGAPKTVQEIKLIGKTLSVLVEDVGFLADAAHDAGYGGGGQGDDDQGDVPPSPPDDGDGEGYDGYGDDNQGDETPPEPPPEDGGYEGQDGEAEDAQDNAPPTLAELARGGGTVADEVQDAEVEEVEPEKPAPKPQRKPPPPKPEPKPSRKKE